MVKFVRVRSAAEVEEALKGDTTQWIRLVLTSNSDLVELTRVLRKFKSSLKPYQISLLGEDPNDANELLKLHTSLESSDLFKAIGSLSGISKLHVKMLGFSIPLLTLLLKQEPLRLRSLELSKVKIQAMTAVERSSFIAVIKDLPSLRLIQWVSYFDNSHHQARATALVKTPKPFLKVAIGVRLNDSYEGMIFQGLERTRTGLDLYSSFQAINVVTEALLGNIGLNHLTFHIFEKGKPSFDLVKARALTSALVQNKSLDTVEVSALPGWALPFVEELVSALPKLMLWRLHLHFQLPSDSQEKEKWLTDIGAALETNYTMREVEINDGEENVRSSLIDFYLRLNQPSRGLACRKDLLTTPTAVPKKKWVKQFIALSRDDDLDGLFYYLSKYIQYMAKEVTNDTKGKACQITVFCEGE